MKVSYEGGKSVAAATPSLRDRKKAETRERIACAAVDLLVNEGAENATIAKIAERADISPRTFHNYFPHRDAALLFTLNQFVEEMVGMVDTAQPGQQLISIGENIAVDLFNRTTGSPNSIQTLSRLADHLLSIPAQARTELFTENDGLPRNAMEFFSPLVQAFQQYSEREGRTLNTAHALLLINSIMVVPTVFVELNESGDCATEEEIRGAFQLLAGGLSQLG